MAREVGPRNIHVAHLVIDAGVDTGIRARADRQMTTVDSSAVCSPPGIVGASDMGGLIAEYRSYLMGLMNRVTDFRAKQFATQIRTILDALCSSLSVAGR